MQEDSPNEVRLRKGRGSLSRATGRFEQQQHVPFYDDWSDFAEPEGKLATTIEAERARSIISSNQSPDIPFELSINPYRGCEHGCVYCFARPTHAWLGLSAGIDFETQLFAKTNAKALLYAELSAKNYRCSTIALGVNTDAYQPAERSHGLTREILQVLQEHRQPVSIVTKSALVERDIDILAEMAKDNLCSVVISVTTLDKNLCRIMEPRATAPNRRLQVIERLAQAGIPCGILCAPVIPFINDHELENILQQCTSVGASSAGYVLLRLPHELRELWKEWLQTHYPERAERVMKCLRDMRGGKEYNAQFGTRMSGTGQYAELLRQRFKLALKKNHLQHRSLELNCDLFRVPGIGKQLDLFDE